MILLLAACSLPSGGPSWTAVDVDAVVGALASPTANLEQALAWLEANPDHLAQLVDSGSMAQDAVQAVAAEPDAPEVSRDTGTLTGTEVFMRVSCDPDPEGAVGTVELESPVLSFDDLVDQGLRGDFLLTATACWQGAAWHDGLAPGWYDHQQETAVVDGEVQRTQVEDDGISLVLRGVLGPTWGLVVPVLDEQTLSLDVDPATPEAGVLRYDGGSLQCALGPPVSCTP